MDIKSQLNIWKQMYDRISLLLEEQKAICSKLEAENKKLKGVINDK